MIWEILLKVLVIYLIIGLIITIIVGIAEKKTHWFFSYVALMIAWPYWLLFDYRYYVRRKRRLKAEQDND